MEDKNKKIESIVAAIEKVYPSTAQMIWRSFLQGLFVALGATVGLAIVISVVTYILTRAQFIPKEYREQIRQVLPEESEKNLRD